MDCVMCMVMAEAMDQNKNLKEKGQKRNHIYQYAYFIRN